MSDHYGYVKRTVGADDEQVDVYVGKNPAARNVFVIDQLHQRAGAFDEHKAMLGFNSEAEARDAYASNFDAGWKVGNVTTMTMPLFKKWLSSGNTRKPLAAVKGSS